MDKELKNVEQEIGNGLDQELSKKIDEAFDKGYDIGYNEGYGSGHEDGRKEGFDEGYKEGYDEGYERGKEDIRSESYDRGHDEAFEEIADIIGRRLRGYGFRVQNIDDVAYEISNFTAKVLEEKSLLEEQVEGLRKIVSKIDLKDITDEGTIYLIIRTFFDKMSDIYLSKYKEVIDGSEGLYEVRQKLGDKTLSKILNFALLNLIINNEIVNKQTRVLFGRALGKFLDVSDRVSMVDMLYEELRRRYNFETVHQILSIRDRMVDSFLDADLASSEYFYNEDIIYRGKEPENIRYVLSERVFNAMINGRPDTVNFRPKKVNYSEFFNVLYTSNINIKDIENGLYPDDLPELAVCEARDIELLRRMNIDVNSLLENSTSFRTKKALLNFYKTNNYPKINLRILGCGGVNSNLIYMWIKSFVELYKFVPELRIEILKFFHNTSIRFYDPDSYEISNIYRIIPPVQVGQPKADNLLKIIRHNINIFTKHIGLGSDVAKFSTRDLERIIRVKYDDTEVFIGMVSLEERPSIYNEFKAKKLPFLEVTSLGDEIYFERNPVINSTDVSIANETYGTLNPARFMSSFFFSWILLDEFLIDVLNGNYSFESNNQGINKLSISTGNTAYSLFKTLLHYDNLKIGKLDPPKE
ncbi:MAG: hypothetical protein QW350_04025 [Candidatus Aenigmatarchaeota archaeon]